MITHLQAALDAKQLADSLSTRKAAFVDTVTNTPPDQLFEILVKDAIQFGLKVLAALLIYLLGAWIIRLIKKSMSRGFVRRKTDPTIVSFMNSLVSICMWTLVIILSVSTLGINTTSLAALLAAGGMAIGMALSGTVQNFAGGLMILIFKPFKVGDFIEAQGFSGVVKEVTIVSTILTTTDNRRIVLPNGALSNGNINNITVNPLRRVDIEIAMSYGCDADAAKQLMIELIQGSELFLDSSTPGAADPFVALKNFSDSSVIFVVRAWTRTENYWTAYFYLNETLYRELPAHGFTFPFPQIDVHMK